MYDIRVHVPQRIETLLEAYNNADIDLFESTVKDIKEMVTDQDFNKDVDDYENEKTVTITNAKKTCKEKFLEIYQQNDDEDLFLENISQQEETLLENINQAISDYMLVTKTYIINYIKHVPIT